MKDLSTLNRDISQTIIVDNSPMSYIFHPGMRPLTFGSNVVANPVYPLRQKTPLTAARISMILTTSNCGKLLISWKA